MQRTYHKQQKFEEVTKNTTKTSQKMTKIARITVGEKKKKKKNDMLCLQTVLPMKQTRR